MDVYNVLLTTSAENDLRDIARYISSQLNAPMTALNMVRTIRKSVAKLRSNAPIYSLVRDDRLAAIGYRSFTVKNYIVFYVVSKKEKTVNVDRILHGRRDWKRIL